ncbi:SLAP domain-containing protein [Lactobacillus juensis]
MLEHIYTKNTNSGSVSNISGVQRKLKHNAYIYTKKPNRLIINY